MDRDRPPEPNTKRPRFVPPPGACDTQIHIYGPAEKYPMSPARRYEPAIVGLDEALEMHAVLGIERGVLVSPTVYRTDNRCMLDGLKRAGPRFRGIAVVDDGITDAELEDMHAAGVRGVRFNFVRFLGMPQERGVFERTIARIAPFGWHAVLHVEGRDLIDFEDWFRPVRIPVVINHMAHLDLSGGDYEKALALMLDLLDEGNWWIQVSNGDRISAEGPPYADTVPLGRTLVEAAPDRAIWATDWPHVQYRKPTMPNDGDLLDLLADFAPDEAVRNGTLVDNPQALYGFED